MINMVIYKQEWHPVYEMCFPENDNDDVVKVPPELIKEYSLALNKFAEVQEKIAKLLGDKDYFFPGSEDDL